MRTTTEHYHLIIKRPKHSASLPSENQIIDAVGELFGIGTMIELEGICNVSIECPECGEKIRVVENL
jgi:hypothetical protein